MAIKVISNFSILFLITGLFISGFPTVVKADSLVEQRDRYQQIQTALAQGNQKKVNQLLPTLVNYPLYPYLRYHQLTEQLNQVPLSEIIQFKHDYPTFPLKNKLMSRTMQLLVNRSAWSAITKLYSDEPSNKSEQCYYQYAHWVTHRRALNQEQLQKIWLTPEVLPKACEPIINVWQQQGHLSSSLILQRLFLLAYANQPYQSLLTHSQLSKAEKTLAKQSVALTHDIEGLFNFAKQFPPTPFSQHVVLTLFPRWLKTHSARAKEGYLFFVAQQKLNKAQQYQLEKEIASSLFSDSILPLQELWRDRIIRTSKDSRLIERRIRWALAHNSLTSADYWISLLPNEEQQKQEWRYWHAKYLLNHKKDVKQAHAILQQLMTERGFYPLIAAQQLEKTYHPHITRVQPQAIVLQQLLQRPELQRVNELLYWGSEQLARQEWNAYLPKLSSDEIATLAHYAFNKGLANFSVQATIKGKLWDHLIERFPIAYSIHFERALQNKAITQSFAMAIARQESAWEPTARSPVGATGLMQLMPSTAFSVAKSLKLTGVTRQQLLNPQLNILLGSTYLDEMYQKFTNNRILAAAAYNAGPHRVSQWLKKSDERLDAAAFIESIPFTETRNYVKNVLCYDVFYSYLMNTPREVLDLHELQRYY